MINNKTKAIIQVLALFIILWIGEFIISAIRMPTDVTLYGFPLNYYVHGADLVSGPLEPILETKGEILVKNLLIDILFWLAIASILIFAKNKLKRNK